MMSSTFLVFLLTGGLAALANIGTRCFLSLFISYSVAIALAFLVGMSTAFLLFKIFVFKAGQSKKTSTEVLWFAAINLFGLLQTLFISIGLKDYAFPWIGFHIYPEDVAHIVGVVVPAGISYFGHKLLTFK